MTEDAKQESVPQAAAAAILERAAELELQSDGEISIEELRRVAVDAGIDVRAFEQALAEALDEHSKPAEVPPPAVPATPPPSSALRRISGWVRSAGLATLGLSIAIGSSMLYGVFGVNADAAAMFSVILAGFVVLGLVWDRRHTRSVVGFLVDLVPLWIGFTLAWMLIDPLDAVGILAGTSLVGAITAVIGSFLVGLPRREPREPLADRSPQHLLGG